MGVDLAICFTNKLVTSEEIIQTAAIQSADVGVVYLVQGTPIDESGQKPFFALWSDGPINLHHLCAETSTRASPVCIAWKVEHGAVGGYVIYQDGVQINDVAATDEEYLLLPSVGVEIAYGIQLPLAPDDRYFFPDLLFDREVICFRYTPVDKRLSSVSNETAIQLLEGELNVEPVLPVDIW